MPPLRRSRAVFETASPAPSASPVASSARPHPQAVKRWRVKAALEVAVGAVSAPVTSAASSATFALPREAELSSDSPLLSSHLSSFLASVAASPDAAERCASVHPTFEAKRGSLVGLSLASPQHSLHVDCSPTSEAAALPPALRSLLVGSVVPARSASSSLPSPPSAPSWPLLLPSLPSLRLLRKALVGPNAPQPPLNPQLRFLTPRIDRLCALTPSLPPLPPLPAASEPSSHVPIAAPLCSERRQRLAAYHSSLLSRYSRAYRVSSALSAEVERGMRGWGDFRCSYAPLLLAERSHRWAVAGGGEQSSLLPLLRLPSSHRVEVVEVGQDPTSALRALMASAPAPAVLGFDTESRPSTQAGAPMNAPSLVQLSSASRSVLVRVHPQSGLPPPLVALLLDAACTKVGQGSHADVQQLCAHYRQLPSELSSSPATFGFLDLFALSSRLRLDRPGLQGLVSGLMGHRLSKGQQMSNWATPRHLTGSQVEYAALDALASLQLKGRLEAVLERLTAVVTQWAEREGVELQALCSEELPVLPVAVQAK